MSPFDQLLEIPPVYVYHCKDTAALKLDRIEQDAISVL